MRLQCSTQQRSPSTCVRELRPPARAEPDARQRKEAQQGPGPSPGGTRGDNWALALGLPVEGGQRCQGTTLPLAQVAGTSAGKGGLWRPEGTTVHGAERQGGGGSEDAAAGCDDGRDAKGQVWAHRLSPGAAPVARLCAPGHRGCPGPHLLSGLCKTCRLVAFVWPGT